MYGNFRSHIFCATQDSPVILCRSEKPGSLIKVDVPHMQINAIRSSSFFPQRNHLERYLLHLKG